MKSDQAGSATQLDTPFVKSGYAGSATWPGQFYSFLRPEPRKKNAKLNQTKSN
jgi:hypothetical protein